MIIKINNFTSNGSSKLRIPEWVEHFEYFLYFLGITVHFSNSIVIRCTQSIDLSMLVILGCNIVHTKTQGPIFAYQCWHHDSVDSSYFVASIEIDCCRPRRFWSESLETTWRRTRRMRKPRKPRKTVTRKMKTATTMCLNRWKCGMKTHRCCLDQSARNLALPAAASITSVVPPVFSPAVVILDMWLWSKKTRRTDQTLPRVLVSGV